jgi:hypothetical protein
MKPELTDYKRGFWNFGVKQILLIFRDFYKKTTNEKKKNREE